MFLILIIIFSFKFINYFINNINYNKNNNISKTHNNIQNCRTQEPWVLMKDPIELDRYAGPLPLGSSAMTQVPCVPKWTRAWLTPSTAQAPHVRMVCQNTGCNPSATCALGSAPHTGSSPSTMCPHVVFLIVITNFLKFFNDDNKNNNNNSNF